jgi:hypothetical protein
MGSYGNNRMFQQDGKYLRAIWNSICDYFRGERKLEDMRYRTSANSMLDNPSTCPIAFQKKIANYDDFPVELVLWYYRLEFMAALNSYTSTMPASHMIAKGYFEA